MSKPLMMIRQTTVRPSVTKRQAKTSGSGKSQLFDPADYRILACLAVIARLRDGQRVPLFCVLEPSLLKTGEKHERSPEARP